MRRDRRAGRPPVRQRRPVRQDRPVAERPPGHPRARRADRAHRRRSGPCGASPATRRRRRLQPVLVVADELADWNTPRRQRTWAQIASAGQVKRGSARVFVISTAGEPHERIDGILGRLLDVNEQDGRARATSPRADDLARSRGANIGLQLLRRHRRPARHRRDPAANPASWVSTRDLAALSRSATLTPGQFLQLHGCVWASSAGPFVSLEEWRAAQVDERLETRGGDHASGSVAVAAGRLSPAAAVTASCSSSGPATPGSPPSATRPTGRYRPRSPPTGSAPCSPPPPRNGSAWSTGGALADGQETTRCGSSASTCTARSTAQIVDRFRADLASGDIKHAGDRRLSAPVLAARIAVDDRGNNYLTDDLEHRVPIAAALAAAARVGGER